MNTLHEPARDVPVVHECDVCVIGGSCTGVFAAVRAARLGARVVIVEKAGSFGGVATLSLVNVWHSPFDTTYRKQIIAGLTMEVIDRLRRRKAVTDRERSPHWAWAFNPQELQIELDELIREAGITPLLHTQFVAPHVVDGQLRAAIIENKSGRQAIRARLFIDASGDGDLCHRAGLVTYAVAHIQPSTTCAAISDYLVDGVQLDQVIREHAAEFDLPAGFAWGTAIPNSPVYMLAGTRVYDANAAEAEQLTFSEMEGRRQVRAIMDLLRKYVPGWRGVLQALPARIGIRETRHVRCQYQLTAADVLQGRQFGDAIANGSYRVDVHHQDKPGITLKYLDGTQEYCCPGAPPVRSLWRPPEKVDPTFYQIPLRSIVPGTFPNLLLAGRMFDAEPEAHAAARVMVNMNQTGEAAGVAAWLALDSNTPVTTLAAARVRSKLAAGGSIIL
ncbi:MAG: hypothetical protein PCFJNLEI_01016 [Verrucomicrobiae bacterium]|nr:hypothetical protein [Verrucomicrobiae bacterium]